MEQMARE
jgi:hypothetical protein